VARESIDESLSRRLIFAMVVPGVLLVVAGMLLLWQLTRLTETARWVDHTDQVIAKIYELQAEIIDQETSLRGFLLSEDRGFLERYLTSTPASSLRELAELVKDNQVQLERAKRGQHLYDRWSELAQKAFVERARYANASSCPTPCAAR
jgi:methyl-accepting chemotaxis protein